MTERPYDDYEDKLYSVTVYSAPFSNAGTNLPVFVPTFTDNQTDIDARKLKEIKQLRDDILLWASGMGEYPSKLADMTPVDIVGDFDSEDPNERSLVPERMIIQILRWVLGEFDVV